MTLGEIMEWVRAALSSVVRYTFVSGSTSDGHDDSVEGEGVAGTGDESARDQGVRRMYPAGFDSRPLPGTEAAVVYNRAAPSGGMMVGNGRRGGDPAIDAGEAVVYSLKEPTCMLYLDDAGVVRLIAKSGQLVFLGTESGAQFVALSNLVDSRLQALYNAISGAAVTPNDGGATLKTNIIAALQANGWPGGTLTTTAATQVKAK